MPLTRSDTVGRSCRTSSSRRRPRNDGPPSPSKGRSPRAGRRRPPRRDEDAVKVVAYFRVSTAKQGASGLGLEAQRAAVAAWTSANGAAVLAGYTEVESGKRADRPGLRKALAHAKRSRATLVIAKLDLLSRNVHFLSGLMESGVDFIACDNPHANRLTIHILAAVAEDEAKRISERTAAAPAAYKTDRCVSQRIRDMDPGGVPPEVVAARGGKLGAALPAGRRLGPEDAAAGPRAAAAKRARRARDACADLAPLAAGWRAEGLSLRAIAARLDAEGQTTRGGKAWNPVQVSRVLKHKVS
jgi:resolvase-like protein/recombinase